MIIRVVDIIHTPNAILQKFGLQVFDCVKPSIESSQEVTLSFEGVRNLTSGFCHASVGNLYQAFPEKAPNLLHLAGIENELWQEKIEEAIYLANNPDKTQLHDESISELFA